jgi:hypothetical protein
VSQGGLRTVIWFTIVKRDSQIRKCFVSLQFIDPKVPLAGRTLLTDRRCSDRSMTHQRISILHSLRTAAVRLFTTSLSNVVSCALSPNRFRAGSAGSPSRIALVASSQTQLASSVAATLLFSGALGVDCVDNVCATIINACPATSMWCQEKCYATSRTETSPTGSANIGREVVNRAKFAPAETLK